MRVITGSAGGRRLISPGGDDITRPTTDKVKEAIFSIIQFDIEGRRVLDLFGGSGQMAVEALSRGAENAVVVDSSKQAADIINENLRITGLAEKAEVFNTDAFSFLASCKHTFDIVFLDPPYKQGLVAKALPLAAEKTADGGIIVCETSSEEELPENAGKFSVYRTYRYSATSVTVYLCRKEEIL